MQLRADDPRRPLDWRFQRAASLSSDASRNRRPRKTDDKLITQYAELLYCLETLTDDFADMEKLRKRFTDLLAVHIAYATLNATELALVDGLLLSYSVDPDLIRRHSGLSAVQQQLYRDLFLDITDRRDMSTFIAMQLLEPSRLRGVISIDQGEGSHPQLPVREVTDDCPGSLPRSFLNTLRVIGFYSSPVVLELLYTGFTSGSPPLGKESALRFITQTQLMGVRRQGILAASHVNSTGFKDAAILRQLIDLSFDLAQAERGEGQLEIIEHIETLFKTVRQRVGFPDKVLPADAKLPDAVYSGQFELTDDELVDARINGVVPDSVKQMEQLIAVNK
jgi:hypothetical protein